MTLGVHLPAPDPMRFPLLFAAGLVALSGCDAAETTPLDTSDLDAVATVASALALDSNGALDEAAHAATGQPYAALRGPGHGGHGLGARGGACDSEADYDADAGLTTITLACERGRVGGDRYATLDRTATAAFRDADGGPVEGAEDAASLTFTIVSGSSAAVSPRGSREVTDVSAAYELTGLDGEAITVNGTSSRSGSYAVTRRDGASRSADYTVTLALSDVAGPAPRRLAPALFRGRWARAVSGTAEGVYRATVTTTTADGEATTETVERPFTVEFPVDREGRARIRMGDRVHDADVTSGDVDA